MHCNLTNTTGLFGRLSSLGCLLATFTLYAPAANAVPGRQWGTYYGGVGDDSAEDVTLDITTNAIVVGKTYSTSGIATFGAADPSHNGGSDAFVAKFGTVGNLQWGTYLGGTGNDWLEEVATGNDDSIYAYGFTSSTAGVATPGSHNQFYNGGSNDGLLAKYSSNGLLKWATYYGGSGTEGTTSEPFSLCISPVDAFGKQYVYITGETNSLSGIATPGAYDITLSVGSLDAYLAKFSTDGDIKWATYYGGSGSDTGLGCAVDASHNVYLTGYTTSDSDIAWNGYDNSYNGNADAFLVKFNSGGMRQWATYYGGLSADKAQGVDVDTSSNVYVVGDTDSSSSIATGGAHDTTLSDVTDAFVVKFNSSGARQWGTYYGGDNGAPTNGNDEFTDIKVVESMLHLSGYTDSTSIATAGAFDTVQSGFEVMYVQMSTGGVVSYATYNGGAGVEVGAGVGAFTRDSVVAGKTSSNADIATVGAHDTSYNGGGDAFITYIGF
jgi:hypothetical protein